MRHQVLIIVTLLTAGVASAQSYTETIKRDFRFENPAFNNTLLVANITGGVTVEAYEGDVVAVQVEKTIRAKSEERLAKAKQNINIGVIDRADTLILYVEGAGLQFGKPPERHKGMRQLSEWCYYDGDGREGGWSIKEEYDVEMNFTIKVPQQVNLILSTIQKGDISVSRTTQSVAAANINGSIVLKDIRGKTVATTINGDVTINYNANPHDDCRYYTLNGDIRVYVPDALHADVSFKSFSGGLYSNISAIEPMPVQMIKVEDETGVRYKVSNKHFRAGKGGPSLSFETFNGDAYITESHLKN